jgi:hypothetical protein
LLTTNPYWEDVYSSIQFYWPDGAEDECLVNTFKNRAMDDTLNGHQVYTFTGSEMPPGWPDLLPYPQCEMEDAAQIDFYNGAIHFVNLLGADVRGDVNLNGVRFEIGDLITFMNYFWIGLPAFMHDVEKQIEATDLNCDGVYLTISDFVFLARIVFGYVDPPCPGWLPTGKAGDQMWTALTEDDDTLSIPGHHGEPGDQDKAIEIRLTNQNDLAGLQARVEYDPDVLNPDWDQVLNDGKSVTYQLVGRAADYVANGGSVVAQSRTEGELLIYFIPDDSVTVSIPSGSGPIINVIFDIPWSSPLGFSTIAPVDDGHETNSLSNHEGMAISPTLVAGRIVVLREVPLPSCPVLFVHDGTDFVVENPLLTACEHSNYTEVVSDFYHVSNHVEASDGVVRFQLREMEEEITYLHDIELITIDHTSNSRVAVAVGGQIAVYEDVVAPLSAVDHRDVDVLAPISAEDGDLYVSREPGSLVVTFPASGVSSNLLGFSSIRKNMCPFKPDGSVVESPHSPNEIGIEYLDEFGNWVEGPAMPSRVNPEQTVIGCDPITVGEQDAITVRISWSDHYSVDVVCRYEPSDDDVESHSWTVSECVRTTQQGYRNTHEILRTGSPIVLKKSETLEFAFDINAPLALGMARDYVIRAVGRYQPDYSVYTNLLPGQFQLYDNYPNPFNPSTTVAYDLPVAAHVRLEVYNLLGQHITTLVDESQGVGHYETVWDSKDDYGNAVASGVYFYRLTTEEFVESRKMMLLK